MDASWKRLNRGCHIVIRDSASRCLAVRRKEIMAPSVLAAEVKGILEGCVMAKQGASQILWWSRTQKSLFLG